MPRFDGTGPQGQGPMTGRAQGYCALQVPDSGQPSYGYAGIQGAPVRLDPSNAWPMAGVGTGRGFLRGRGRGAGRGRGRRSGRW